MGSTPTRGTKFRASVDGQTRTTRAYAGGQQRTDNAAIAQLVELEVSTLRASVRSRLAAPRSL